jgi:hypothetical protein
MPRPIEARLRADAAAQQRTMTDILLAALAFAWEHAGAVEELAQTRKVLWKAEQRCARLQRRTEAQRIQAKTDKKARADLEWERDATWAALRGAREELTIFQAENPDQAEEIARRYAKVQEEAFATQMAAFQEALARALVPNKQAGAKMVSLRELAKLAHPDLWHGKPAIELGEEIMKLANR